MEEATVDIVDNQIPQIVSLMNAGQLHVDNIDVFYETGVFEKESTKKILLAGKNAGLKINFHGDELNSNNSGQVRFSFYCLCVSTIFITSVSQPVFARLLIKSAIFYLILLSLELKLELLQSVI